jgi:molybdopterin converting factor subunit 1
MRVTVLYFAAARERAGAARDSIEVSDGATARDVLMAAVRKHPQLEPIQDKLRVAVDQEFDGKPREGSEVALIPPVSGGAGAHRIGEAPIDPLAPLRAVEGPDCGAIATFCGSVRSPSHGKEVVRLEYEAYPEMALKLFERIADSCREKFKARVAIHHRTGKLSPGEISVAIAAAAPHRKDAFDACREAIEALKADVPIWKREVYPDGSVWVGLGS